MKRERKSKNKRPTCMRKIGTCVNINYKIDRYFFCFLVNLKPERNY